MGATRELTKKGIPVLTLPVILLILAVVCALIAAFAGYGPEGRGFTRINFLGFSLAFYYFAVMAGVH